MGIETLKQPTPEDDVELPTTEGIEVEDLSESIEETEMSEGVEEIEKLENELSEELSSLAEEVGRLPSKDELGEVYPEGVPSEIVDEADTIKKDLLSMAKGERGSVSTGLLVLLGGTAVSAALFYLGAKTAGFDSMSYVSEFQKAVGTIEMITAVAVGAGTWVSVIAEMIHSD